MRVPLGHTDRFVSQQVPDFRQADPDLHQPGGKGVAQVVDVKIRDAGGFETASQVSRPGAAGVGENLGADRAVLGAEPGAR